MEMDRISVIVPVYKVEKYLERCIRSIQNQTYQNLEILLMTVRRIPAGIYVTDMQKRMKESMYCISKTEDYRMPGMQELKWQQGNIWHLQIVTTG